MLRLIVFSSDLKEMAWSWGVGNDIFYARRLSYSWNPKREFLLLQRARLVGGEEILISGWCQVGTHNSGESFASFDCYPMPFSEWRIWVAGLRSIRRSLPPSGSQL